MHVEVLSPTDYKETPTDFILPTSRMKEYDNFSTSDIFAPQQRLHHIDAQEITPMNWMYLVDGEQFGNDLKRHEPLTDEQSASTMISTVFTSSVSIAIALALLIFVLSCRFVMKLGVKNFYVCPNVHSCFTSLQSFFGVYKNVKQTRPRFMALVVSLTILIISFYLSYRCVDGPLRMFSLQSFLGANYNFLRKSEYESVQEVMVALPEGSPYQIKSLEIITGASAPYYPRILNLIGSIHTFQGDLRIHVYDVGFTTMQRQVLACMENVQLYDFNFSRYPSHTRDLGSFVFFFLSSLSRTLSLSLSHTHINCI